MSSLKLELSNEPDKKDLLDEEEKRIENNDDIEINYEYQLQKCFPNLKECKDLYKCVDDFHPNYNEKIETKKYTFSEKIGNASGYSIVLFLFFLLIFSQSVVAFFIIYFILVGLQFFHPEIKLLFKAKELNKKDFEEFQNKINDMTKANISFETQHKNEKSFDFVVKNYMDISGELDMTKPPKGNNSVAKKKNFQQKSLNNKVIIITSSTRLYTIDKETEKKIELYKKEFGVVRKMPENISYVGEYYRKCNYCYLISTLFLCSSYFFSNLGVDVYYIEPRKIISCEEDLNDNYYVSLSLSFIPKYTFYTGEQVLFNDNCIIKADNEKLKEFNDNYNKMMKIINERLEKEKKRGEKFKELGIYRGLELYHNTLGNLEIKAFISDYERIELDLIYCLDGYVKVTYLNYPNHVQISDKISFDCLKEGLEKKGKLTYLYIKYLKEPIIIGNYNALSYTWSYRDEEHTFVYYG